MWSADQLITEVIKLLSENDLAEITLQMLDGSLRHGG
jgi:hypothetical protein